MHLLLVDDEPVIRNGLRIMAESFQPAFAKIDTAENGLTALELIQAKQPTILCTDIRMPKMDGLELCRRVYEKHPHVQMIVVSGYNDFEYARQSMAYGVQHYLLKPVTKIDLHDVLQQVLTRQAHDYASISHYVKWIDQMEECIWTVDKKQLQRLNEQWREYCTSSNLEAAQLKELLDDCMTMLLKRLQARSFSPVTKELQLSGARVEDLLDNYEQALAQIMTDLLSTRSGNFKDPMLEAKAYIDGRLSEDISLEEVAGMVGLSPTYFSALFKKLTNETFVHYRINKRIEKAKELLGVPHYRIVDIAIESGYEDYPHFTKSFKKIVGVSPSEYRNRLGIK